MYSSFTWRVEVPLYSYKKNLMAALVSLKEGVLLLSVTLPLIISTKVHIRSAINVITGLVQ